MNFLVKRMLKKKLEKEDKKFIVPHFPGGVITTDELRKIADTCEKFPEAKIKLTGELIIGGIGDETTTEELRNMLALPTVSIAGSSVRPVKICSGGFICGNNLQDSSSLGLKKAQILIDLNLLFKRNL